jgi:3-phenylpropionate/cinnamic acid dioxygenase small subunit
MARMTPEQVVDRLEIDDLLTRYATAIDTGNFDLLDDVFMPDAHVDYTSAGGIAGDFPTVKAWLSEVLPHFPAYQHLVGNRNVVIDGDSATSKSVFYNPMIQKNGDTFFVGGEYHDKIVRGPNGWRIAERIEKTVWTYGAVPPVPQTGDGS